MQIVETPTVLPGCCRVCGGASKPWYLDLGTSEEFYGAVYYCNECLAEMARLAGYMTPEDRQKQEARIEELTTANFELQIKLEGMVKALDGLYVAGLLPSPPSTTPTRRGDLSEVVDSSVDEPQGGTGQLGEGEGTSAESSDDEGVGIVRSDGSSDSTDFSLSL